MPQNMEGIKMPSFQELLEKYKELRHDKNGVDR